MNLFAAILIGALVGWIAYRYLNAQDDRALHTTLFIGVAGGGIGASLAPMLTSAASVEGQFNVFSLFIAAIGAGVCLIAANMIQRRFGA